MSIRDAYSQFSSLLRRIPTRLFIFSTILLIAVFALILLEMGRVPWCECGYVKLWHGVTMSSENSQHISDWYTPSHVIHGFAFYALLWLIGRRWPIAFRLLAAVCIEVSWEIFENTDFVINRYRETTISLDYYGDSVLNSVSDVLAMMLGFALAYRLPIRIIVASTILMEFFVGYAIRDNLALNIIMLIHPSDAIIRWQGGG